MSLASTLRRAKKIITQSSQMSKDRYIWIDLEMTGLDPQKDHVLEIACLVTKPDLEHCNTGINIIINQSNQILDSMNDWCKIHHSKSGLVHASKNSTVTVPEAESQVLNYIKSHIKDGGVNYLAGNSVYMDLMFLKKFFPTIANVLHYRLLDVSSLKVLFSHAFPEEFKTITKNVSHRALDDIYSSINELETYKKLFIK